MSVLFFPVVGALYSPGGFQYDSKCNNLGVGLHDNVYQHPKHSRLLLPQTYFDNNLFPFTGLYHNPIVYWGIDAN